jgi:hypothetical protein
MKGTGSSYRRVEESKERERRRVKRTRRKR